MVINFGEAKASLPEENSGDGTLVPSKKRLHSHLPHIDIRGYYQFVTFRTYDSIDNYLQKLYDLNLPNRQKQYKIDRYLDSSKKGDYLNSEILSYLYDFFIEQDKILYKLIAFCIMPNHVHILFNPFDKLPKVMQKIKGISAKEINLILNKKGRFWANDYYDKAIRDERHFFVTYEYIKNNPLKLEGGTKVPLPRFYGIYEL